MRQSARARILHLRQTQRYRRGQDRPGRFCHTTIPGCLDLGRQNFGTGESVTPAGKLELIMLVSGRSIRSLARQRRPSRACCLLLGESVYEAVPQYQQQ